MNVGVLALQGDFLEHLKAIERCDHCGVKVRSSDDLALVDCLIIPGGESTTFGILMERYGLLDAIPDYARQGMPIFGTCAGAIVLAKRIDHGRADQQLLRLMDIVMTRNAFGRQVDSFEAEIDIEGIDGEAMRAVFIRAPVVSDVGDGVVKIASLDDGQAVAVKKGRVLASSFHPELTTDTRMHSLFVELAREGQIDTLNPTRNAEEISNTA